MDHNKLQKFIKEMGIPDHLTYLLRNLYAGQEATVRPGHGTMDRFKLGQEYVKTVYYHPAHLTYMQSESEVAQSCPTLWNPMNYSLPGSSAHGIFQARVLDGLPFPSPGDLPNQGIKPGSPALQADALPSEPPGKLKRRIGHAKCQAG